MPRQGEFSDPASDAAHATTVLRPLLGSAPMLAAWVRAIRYSVWTCGPCCTCSDTPRPVHNRHMDPCLELSIPPLPFRCPRPVML